MSTSTRLPATTPVTQLGLNAAEQAKLTPTARKITKGELISLHAFAAKHRQLDQSALVTAFDKQQKVSLTVADLHSLEEAFVSREQRLLTPGAAADTSACCCCSCCPCCSCTASVVTDPVISGSEKRPHLRASAPARRAK